MTSAAWLVPALPFAAALVGFVVPQRSRPIAAALAVGGTTLATLAGIALLAQVLPHAARHSETSAPLAPFGAISVTVGTRSDGLACVVAVMVCVVALLVQVYSIGYLADDDHYPRYAAEVSLFTAAMLLVVLAGDLIELYAGWEVMGICSYLLIGHYRELPEAPAAAVKAFVVTRVGDIGFLLGVLLLGFTAGSFRIAAVLGAVGSMPRGALLAATLLLLAGVAGKSAQFPLQTWLPDAMAGPTPISALIHAATMVAAGAYVVARLYPLFAAAPVSLTVLGVVAAVTMLLGALSALGQDDLKRVLAWSTVSQLAYITGGLAVGGVTAGMFHLLTHAAFKALLFLGAGVVLHATGEQVMSRMGGLWRRLPLTFATMVIGSAALAGLPPLAGAFSKDSILAAALECARGDGAAPAWVGWLVYLSGLTTAFVTAAYVTRMLLLTFLGERRTTAHVHAAPLTMTVPVVALSVPALLLGAVAGLIGGWMPPLVPGTGTVRIGVAALGLTTAVVLAGAAVVLVLWWRRREDPLRVVAPVVPLLRSGFRFDALQDALVVRPYRTFATTVLRIDTRVVDGAVRGSGAGARRTGRLLSRLQTGNVQSYVSGVVAASVVLAVVMAVVFPIAVFR